jgi:hypothetical protein
MRADALVPDRLRVREVFGYVADRTRLRIKTLNGGGQRCEQGTHSTSPSVGAAGLMPTRENPAKHQARPVPMSISLIYMNFIWHTGLITFSQTFGREYLSLQSADSFPLISVQKWRHYLDMPSTKLRHSGESRNPAGLSA